MPFWAFCFGSGAMAGGVKAGPPQAITEKGVFDFGDYGVLYPSVFTCVGGFSWFRNSAPVGNIMEAPVDGTVATMDLNNALSLLHFEPGDRCGVTTVKRDFLPIVTGPYEYRFTRNYSRTELAYTMTRGFAIARVPERRVDTYTIIEGLSGWVERFEPLNPRNGSFVFMRETLTEVPLVKKRTLLARRFASGKQVEIGQIEAGRSDELRAWLVFDDHLFLFDKLHRRLDVFTDELVPTRHPFADAFNEVAHAFPVVTQIVVHPSLPMAVMMMRGPVDPARPADGVHLPETVYVLRWGKAIKEARLVRWFSGDHTPWGKYRPLPLGLQLSPDGNWLVVRVGRDVDRAPYESTPMAVSGEYHIALPFTATSPAGSGKPIKLFTPGEVGMIIAESSAFTRSPGTFVTANHGKLCRWNLDEAARAQWALPRR